MNENKIPQMLTIKEASHIFNMSEYLLRTQAKQGAFPAIMIGKKILINRDKLIEYLNTNTLSSTPPPAPTPIGHKSDSNKPDSRLVKGLTPIRI